MNLPGINDDLVPAGFVSPPYGPKGGRVVHEEANMDQNGKPLYPGPDNLALGHYVPFLTACVVDDTVAVIPGGPGVCARLGIPALDES